jgi:hypothetical protein
MSEAMTSEKIVEAEWLLKGYWTKLRFAYQTNKKGWSDIDVLAYNPETKHLIVSESKVRGGKKNIYAFNFFTEGSLKTIDDFDRKNYFSFLKNLPEICADRMIFQNFSKMVKKITIQLVSNYIFEDEVKKKVEQIILNSISDLSVLANIKHEIKIDSTLEVIARIITLENEKNQGKRFGHPVIDFVREINRFFNPKIKYAGRGRKEIEWAKKKAIKTFLEALNCKP